MCIISARSLLVVPWQYQCSQASFIMNSLFYINVCDSISVLLHYGGWYDFSHYRSCVWAKCYSWRNNGSMCIVYTNNVNFHHYLFIRIKGNGSEAYVQLKMQIEQYMIADRWLTYTIIFLWMILEKYYFAMSQRQVFLLSVTCDIEESGTLYIKSHVLPKHIDRA